MLLGLRKALTGDYVSDHVTPLVAWSLKKLVRGYSGPALRSRRADNGLEQDAGFIGDVLDTASIASFCSGTTGQAPTVYDQWLSGNNLIRASGQGGVIYNGSVLSAIAYDGTSQGSGSNSAIAYGANKITIFAKLSVDLSGGNPSTPLLLDVSEATDGTYLYYDRASSSWLILYTAGGGSYNIRSLGTLTGIASISTLTILIDNTASSSTQYSAWLNGASATTSSTANTATPSGSNIPTSQFYLAQSQAGSALCKMGFVSYVACAGDQTASRTLVEPLL